VHRIPTPSDSWKFEVLRYRVLHFVDSKAKRFPYHGSGFQLDAPVAPESRSYDCTFNIRVSELKLALRFSVPRLRMATIAFSWVSSSLSENA